MKLNLDDWQQEFIAAEGDKILCCGRQVGKSTICGIDAGEYAASRTKPEDILMIAPVERQAYALYEQTLRYTIENHPKMLLKDPKNKPTKTRFCLSNGVRVWCLPVGLEGLGIRFISLGRLYADESSRIPHDVWTAVLPTLATTGGARIYLSTANGAEGEFAGAWLNKGGAYDTFKRFTIGTEECYRKRKISATWTEKQRDKALNYVANERKKMSRLEAMQEFDGLIVDEIRQFFKTDLIRNCMKLTRETIWKVGDDVSRSLGADVARLGGDESALVGLGMDRRRKLRQVYQEAEQDTRLTDFARKVEAVGTMGNFSRLYIDDGGLGAGVVDILLEGNSRRKVRAINNASWIYSNDGKDKRLMKEHLYNNLLKLMEHGEIELFKDEDLFNSLHSIQAEYTDGKLRIFGKYSHLTEALVRAAWIVKEKGLNLWVH